MMSKKTTISHWKQYHHSLPVELAKLYKAEIERVLGICQSAFYRKIKEPERYLCIAEKRAIAQVYGVPEALLFPEHTAQAANTTKLLPVFD
jgi:hypothetical protein